jgi:soluble lytic murein transglycosylase-like protein
VSFFLRRTLVVIAAIACVAIASVADAQIYSWRDASGSLVLSDQAPAKAVAGVRTFRVPHAMGDVLATKPSSADYHETYDNLIVQHAQTQGLRPDLVRAVVQVESGYNARAVSSKGALGLMQLMPSTAAQLGVQAPFDPGENIRGGTTYLRQLLDRFNGSEELALAAYNAGPTAVDRYGNQIPPYAETQDYVRKIRTQTTTQTGQAGQATQPGQTAKPAPPPPPVRQIYYKTVETIDGRPVVRYSDTLPASGPYEVIKHSGQ